MTFSQNYYSGLTMFITVFSTYCNFFSLCEKIHSSIKYYESQSSSYHRKCKVSNLFVFFLNLFCNSYCKVGQATIKQVITRRTTKKEITIATMRIAKKQ